MDNYDMSALDALAVNHADDSDGKNGNDARDITSKAIITQIRAARGLLGWRQKQLAYHAKTAPLTISRLERGEKNPRFSTLLKIRSALEDAGVEFLIADEYGGVGVRLCA
jgi:ribosome-binding protein aMBF1 (putative translation factor)